MKAFKRYNKLIACYSEAITSTLANVAKGHVSKSSLIKHKLLLFSAEQLGRERALVSGYLDCPENLSLPSVMSNVMEIIGARKMLLGCSDPSSDDDDFGGTDLVIAGELGLLKALGLMS